MTSLTSRCLDDVVDGAVNFRDLGGHRAGDARVRHGVIFRSGMTHHISETGVRHLVEAYSLRTVIDLRVEKERIDDGIAPFEQHGIACHHLPMGDTSVMPEEIRKQRFEEMRAGTFDWTASYLRMARNGSDGFRRVFEILSEPGALPTVFHCVAGRDRTGVSAALLLASLGVDHADIAHDYALTGSLLQPHVHRFMRPAERSTMTVEQMANVLLTAPEAMRAFLDALDQEYGSTAGYLDSIGVHRDTLGILRATLLEPAA